MSAENIFFFGLPWPKGHDRSVKATDGAGFDGPPYFGLHSSHDINCDGFFLTQPKSACLAFSSRQLLIASTPQDGRQKCITGPDSERKETKESYY